MERKLSMLSNVIFITNITHFKELLDRASYILKSGDNHIVFDFNDVDYAPSEIIGALISITNKVKDLGGTSAIINVGPEMLEQLTTLGIPLES
jgi:anti-anti-sigma regulatory factor